MPAPGPGDAAGDAVLVERLRSDEPDDAMRALFRLYGGELYAFTLHVLGDRGAAEEIVEEVFLRAWRHAARYDPERAAVRAWLYQIARNAIIDARRRPGRPGAGPPRPRAGRRWSRRCSAGRSRLRSSGSRPSTAR